MSDISIPGVRSRFNTEQIIQDLMKLERVPLTRMEDSLKNLEKRKTTWRDIGTEMGRLRDSARALFGFQNPFNERLAVSSDEQVLTAVATREAVEGRVNVRVLQTAAGDRFLSANIAEDVRVPEGRYGFRVGDREFSFSFRGGTLSSFVQALNERSGGIIRAQIIRNTPTSSVLMLESQRTGSANRIDFTGDSLALGESIGMLRRSTENAREIALDASALRPWTTALDKGDVEVENGVLRLHSGAEAVLPITPPFPVTEAMRLEMEVRVLRRAEDAWSPPPAPPGPDIPTPEAVTVGDATVRTLPSRVILPELKQPEPPVVREDPNMLFTGTPSMPIPLPPLSDSAAFVKYSVPIRNYTNLVSHLLFRNANTHRDLEVRGIRIHDPAARADYIPLNPISTARDALIEFDGVPVERPTNSIDDLIPGVTLTITGISDRPVELSIEPNREAVKSALISFVGHYNRLIGSINILTRREPAIVNEIDYLTDAERETAFERLGLFQGDLTLSQMRSNLQNIMMNSYRTRADEKLSLLAQIGISTNVRTGNFGFDAARLRGYLEIDEKRLDAALKNQLPAVRDLFGRDSDGDLVVDSGVAFAVDNFSRPFVQTGGILSLKGSTLDSQISRTNRDIQNFNERLSRYEAELRQRYGAMEGALNALERDSRAIDNFSRSPNTGRN